MSFCPWKSACFNDFPLKTLHSPTFPQKLDDGWPESVVEQGLLLLVWRHIFTNNIWKMCYRQSRRGVSRQNSEKCKTIVCIANTFTHRSFYTQTLLHTKAFTHRSFYTQKLLHRRFYTQSFYPQKLLHTGAFTYRSFYTQTLLHRHFYTQTRLHTNMPNNQWGKKSKHVSKAWTWQGWPENKHAKQ